MATMMAARFEKNGSYPSWVEMEAFLMYGKHHVKSEALIRKSESLLQLGQTPQITFIYTITEESRFGFIGWVGVHSKL